MKVRRHVEAILIISFFLLAGFLYRVVTSSKKSEMAIDGAADSMTTSATISLFELFPDVTMIKTIQNEPVGPLIHGQGNHAPDLVFVHYWATWCAPCVTEVPSLASLARYLGKKALILAISGDTDLKEIGVFLKSFKEMTASNIKIIHDADQKLRSRMSVKRLPETYIFNRQGSLVKKISGSEKWDTPEAKEYFDLMIKKSSTL